MCFFLSLSMPIRRCSSVSVASLVTVTVILARSQEAPAFSGSVFLSAGSASSGSASTGGSVQMVSGKGASSSGSVKIRSADNEDGGTSGDMYLASGMAKSGSTGNVTVQSGAAIDGSSGELTLSSGDSATGIAGDVKLVAGTSGIGKGGNVIGSVDGGRNGGAGGTGGTISVPTIWVSQFIPSTLNWKEVGGGKG